jgi:DNA-binding HxlR family transcriptional regulator
MTTTDAGPVIEYLKAVGHEARLRLLGLLATGERSVGELAEILELREPTISHHLAKLAAVGLVRMRAEGTVHHYRLDTDGLQALNRDLFTPERLAEFAPTATADAWEEKVLRTFVVDGRLTRIPAARKKRDVVLRWLAERFEPGRRYAKREVNDLIARHHPDFATLRRELVDGRWMTRAEGVDWRMDQEPKGSF